ncbi:MAG: PINc/VapC family ATPase [Candidatus Hadarchaeum sp.]|uniref:PINc/VapC family ATPase n=1 Tax=Candidatus Hadarchaeum sp. TaxID=2883567 RepID=UPI003D134F6E
MKSYVPDASALMDAHLTRLIRKGDLQGCRILVPNQVVAKLESEARLGKDSGFSGLAELRRLKQFSEEGRIKLELVGERPAGEEAAAATNASVREVARVQGAVLMTSDEVMAEVGRVEGLEVWLLQPVPAEKMPRLLEYFKPGVMSVHLKEKVRPMAKIGRPDNLRLEVLDENPLTESQLREMAHEIIERARQDPEGLVEIERAGATVIQFHEYRIAIARPPFSDGLEITAVRPIVKVTLDDYHLSEKLKKRLRERAEGVLIAGPPGAGKTTFAQALAEFYRAQGKIVKTMESPRDLQVADEITQYTALEGDMTKTADILLLVRPDYTIYDELRKTSDFQIFADMRLAGVGMVGVVHSTRAIDAVQRLIGRVELGMIPMIADTVIFIKEGQIREVYSLSTRVGVPHGMTEADLARPMVEVTDFETGEPVYQIYSFGEEVVVMPVRRETSRDARMKAEMIRAEIRRLVRGDVEVKMLSDDTAAVIADEEDIARIIGRGGRTVARLERKLGVRIEVRSRESEET